MVYQIDVKFVIVLIVNNITKHIIKKDIKNIEFVIKKKVKNIEKKIKIILKIID